MKNTEKYDFAGWATKCDIVCSDNRVIKKGAFKHQNGQQVPLCWNHDHKNPDNVLGHALLEDRDEGVYAYCSFNNNEKGNKCRELVQHGDITSLSIYANQLKQNGNDVIHGNIREVSLVLAGANMGAHIETVIAHSDEHDEESVIYHQEDDAFEFYHSEEENKEGENKDMPQDEVKHAEEGSAENKASGKTIQAIFDSMTDEQKEVVYYLAGVIEENAKAEAAGAAHSDDQNDDQSNDQNNNLEHSEEGENNNIMKTNVFEGTQNKVSAELLHSAFEVINTNAKKSGSFKDAYNEYVNTLAHSEDANDQVLAHSITDVGNLFPEVKPVNGVPETISRRQDWVAKVMSGVHHSPFARVKSTAINITADNARAKGYVTGEQKAEEVVVALKRTTTPQTVYKLQKLDRDDVLDITDFDVVVYIKAEMRVMLDEEIARAILIGDGRSNDSDDKINPLNIRPVLNDNSVYTIAKDMTKIDGENEYAFAKRFIKEAVKARKEYKGSGNLTFWCTEDLLDDLLLIEDTNGRRIYETEASLASALRVKEIVSVPVFANIVRTDSTNTYDYKLMGIFVNLTDYNVGADKGGNVSMFDDFDINYNKYEYLIETRISGALVKPYSAITFEEKYAHVAG